MRNHIIQGSMIFYLGMILTVISFVLLGIDSLDIDPLITVTHVFIGMAVLFFTLAYVIELMIQSFRSEKMNWIDLSITLGGLGVFFAFFGGINVKNPDLSTYFILYIPQSIWIILGLKNFISSRRI